METAEKDTKSAKSLSDSNNALIDWLCKMVSDKQKVVNPTLNPIGDEVDDGKDEYRKNFIDLMMPRDKVLTEIGSDNQEPLPMIPSASGFTKKSFKWYGVNEISILEARRPTRQTTPEGSVSSQSKTGGDLSYSDKDNQHQENHMVDDKIGNKKEMNDRERKKDLQATSHRRQDTSSRRSRERNRDEKKGKDRRKGNQAHHRDRSLDKNVDGKQRKRKDDRGRSRSPRRDNPRNQGHTNSNSNRERRNDRSRDRSRERRTKNR